MRWLACLLFCGCYLSHGHSEEDGGVVQDVPRIDVATRVDAGPDVPLVEMNPVCCSDACRGDDFCGLDICGQVTRFVCGPANGCTLTLAECDEASDCAEGDVCRSAEDGLFRCLAPLPQCSGPLPMIECNYACSSDEECPAAAAQCLFVTATPLGGCPSIGFCRPFR